MKGFVFLTTLMALMPVGFSKNTYNTVPYDLNNLPGHVSATCRSR